MNLRNLNTTAMTSLKEKNKNLTLVAKVNSCCKWN